MPPKRRVPPKGGPKKVVPEVVLDSEAKEQLRAELDWTISQLQMNMQKAKRQEQAEKFAKVITTLSKYKFDNFLN